MDDATFKALVDQAIKSIPKKFLDKMDNVSVVIEDSPGIEQLRQTGNLRPGRTLYGLYQGIPQTKRGRYGVGMTLPDKITIFKMPILATASSLDHLKEIIKSVVVHEIAHHFGMNETMVRDAEGARNRKTK